jgi:hypothetical protein
VSVITGKKHSNTEAVSSDEILRQQMDGLFLM